MPELKVHDHEKGCKVCKPNEEKTTVKFIEDWDEIARILKCKKCRKQFICLDVGYKHCPWCARVINWE